MKPLMQTERLYMRPLEQGDLSALADLLHDPQVRRYLCDDQKLPPATIAGFIVESARLDSRGLGYWVIGERDGDPFIGVVGLTDPSDEFPLMQGGIEVLVALRPGGWGRGLATEAAMAVLARAAEVGVDRVVAGVDVPNVASHRLMYRVGFEEVGRGEGPMGENVFYEMRLSDDRDS